MNSSERKSPKSRFLNFQKKIQIIKFYPNLADFIIILIQIPMQVLTEGSLASWPRKVILVLMENLVETPSVVWLALQVEGVLQLLMSRCVHNSALLTFDLLPVDINGQS